MRCGSRYLIRPMANDHSLDIKMPTLPPTTLPSTAPSPTDKASSHRHKIQVEAWYTQHSNELIAYITKHFDIDRAAAEDIAHLTMVRMTNTSSEIRNIRVFAFRVAHNLAIDACRREQLHNRKHEELQQSTFQQNDISPEREYSGKQLLSKINSVIWSMPEKRRKLFTMHRLEQLSYAEIDRRTGLSESAVRKHVAKGLDDCLNAMGGLQSE